MGVDRWGGGGGGARGGGGWGGGGVGGGGGGGGGGGMGVLGVGGVRIGNSPHTFLPKSMNLRVSYYAPFDHFFHLITANLTYRI